MYVLDSRSKGRLAGTYRRVQRSSSVKTSQCWNMIMFPKSPYDELPWNGAYLSVKLLVEISLGTGHA